jgi:hypothetical protein
MSTLIQWWSSELDRLMPNAPQTFWVRNSYDMMYSKLKPSLSREALIREMVPEEDKQVKSKYLIYLSYIHFED